VGVACFAPRLTSKGGTILGILAGLLAYSASPMQDPQLLELTDKPLVIGRWCATEGYLTSISGRWHDIGELH